MRLMEFIFAYSANPDNITDDFYYDSFDIGLKKAKRKRVISAREHLAQMYLQYEAEKAKRDEYWRKLTEYLDKPSRNSKSSSKSMVGSSKLSISNCNSLTGSIVELNNLTNKTECLDNELSMLSKSS